MKLPTILCFSLAFLIAVSNQQTLPACVLDNGCIANLTILQAHLPISDHPPLNFKITSSILLFPDKMVFSFENSTIKSLSYGEVPLDCGPFGTKLCTVSEYQSKFPDKMVAHVEFIKSLCFIIPSIFSDKVTYLCHEKNADDFEFMDRINTLSRLIDNYKMKMLKEPDNPLLRFPIRHHSLFYVTPNHSLTLVTVKLFPINVQGFLLDNRIFDWDLHSLSSSNKPIQMVNEALKIREITPPQYKALQRALNHSKTMSPEDCLLIFLLNSPNYLCSKNNHSLMSIKEALNAQITRFHYLRDFLLLSTITQNHNGAALSFHPHMREMATLKDRVLKLEQYDSIFCLKNRRLLNDRKCQEAKNRDIVDEMHFLSQNSGSIFSSLEQTQKHPVILSKTRRILSQKPIISSFIQLEEINEADQTQSQTVAASQPAAPESPTSNDPSEAQLQKSQVFKKKVMEDLQKNRKWTISQDERAKGDFRKRTDSDPFVTYLGYIRDSSINAFKAQQKKLLTS